MGTFPNCDIKVVDLEVARVIKEDEKICEIIGTPDYVGKKKYFVAIIFHICREKTFSEWNFFCYFM